MPHKYQREIEEILRNIEKSDSPSDLGERIRPFARPRRFRAAGPRVSFVPQIELPTGLMLLGIVIALVGAGLAFYQTEASLVSGIIALVGFVLIILGIGMGWWARFRGVNVSARSLRRPARSENVVRMRPTRSTPLSRLMTNIRMRQVRRRFRNSSDR